MLGSRRWCAQDFVVAVYNSQKGKPHPAAVPEEATFWRRKQDWLLHADRNFLAISWLAIGPILARGIKSIAPSTCNCREQLPEAWLHPRKLATGDKWEMRIWVWAVWKWEINKEWSWYCYREILLLLSSDLGLGIFICSFTTLLQRHGDWFSHLDLVHTHDKGASSGFELLTKSDISPKDDSRSCSAHWAALV